MAEQSVTKRNLRMSGTGTSAGGTFNLVRVLGEGSFEGDIECQVLKVVGTFQAQGSVRAKIAHVTGTADIKGSLHGDDLKGTGEWNIQGDCNAEKFTIRGTFRVGGLLNAGKLNVRLFGPATAKEIGGDHITVKANMPFAASYKTLTVDLVEGEEIHLEHTKATVVRGNRVYIGPGCDIDRVEYKNDFRQSQKARVTEATRV